MRQRPPGDPRRHHGRARRRARHADIRGPERGSGATPAGDVYALGALLRHMVGAEGAPVIEAWTAPLLAADPLARPTAAHAAAALARCAEPLPIRAIESSVAAAMRAGGEPRTLRRPADRWWHAERAAKRLAPLAGLGVIAALAGSSLVPALQAAPMRGHLAERMTVGVTTVPVAAEAFVGPADAAERLTAARIEALAMATLSHSPRSPLRAVRRLPRTRRRWLRYATTLSASTASPCALPRRTPFRNYPGQPSWR